MRSAYADVDCGLFFFGRAGEFEENHFGCVVLLIMLFGFVMYGEFLLKALKSILD